jgi:ribosomal 50S subunit-associated protein YjgA (DUF615 family)
LIADARAERARGAPPRKSRALFRELKQIMDVYPRLPPDS